MEFFSVTVPEIGVYRSLPIWKEFMKLSLRKYGESDFTIPKGIVNVAIDVETGKLADESGTRFIESFVEGTEPGNDTEELFDAEKPEDFSILDSEDFYSNQ